MEKSDPPTHISPALWQLRGWVSLCALLVLICSLSQMLIFGFVRYTDVRWSTLRPAPTSRAPIVLDAATAAAAVSPPPLSSSSMAARPSPIRDAAVDAGPVPIDPNHVRSNTDSVLRLLSSIVASIRMSSAVVLAMLTMMGVLTAAGGSVPGVEKTVTASFWALVLATACVPWSRFAGAPVFPGVFAHYDTLTELADQPEVSSLGLFAQFLMAPIAAAAVAVCVMLWFRFGVERGIVHPGILHLDQRTAAEMAAIAARGATSLSAGPGRAVGALTRAMGDPASPLPLKKAAGAESMSPDDTAIASSLLRQRSRPDQGESTLRRPI